MFFLAYAHGTLTRTKSSGAKSFEWSCNGVSLYKTSDILTPTRPPSIFDIMRYWLIGQDIANPVLKIKFGDIRLNIKQKEDENARKTVKAYQDAIKSVHEIIDKDTEIQRSILSDSESRYFQPEKYGDLKDLAEIFYLERINYLDAGK